MDKQKNYLVLAASNKGRLQVLPKKPRSRRYWIGHRCFAAVITYHAFINIMEVNINAIFMNALD